MKSLYFLGTLFFTLVVPANTRAAEIDFNSFTASPSAATISDGTLAWAYYSDVSAGNYQADNPAPTTDALNLGNFTAFTTNGGYPAKNPNGITAISYVGGVGGSNPATLSGSSNYDQIQLSANGDSFTITSKLFSPAETFNFYLVNYSTASDLTASLNDAANTHASVSDKTLSGTDPSGSTSALLTLTVTGNVGDLLTFTDAVNDSDPGTGQFGGITGLQAVTVLTAPEPSIGVMLLGGGALLILIGRFRRALPV